MILPAQTIRKLAKEQKLIVPYLARRRFKDKVSGRHMTCGLGPATYDMRIGQTVVVKAHGCKLASTMEKVNMPNDLRATICDKSSWARQFLAVQNTKVDPGFSGYLTIELTNHTDKDIKISRGAPIMQLEFARLETPTTMPYKVRYQNQPARPVPYRPAKSRCK